MLPGRRIIVEADVARVRAPEKALSEKLAEPVMTRVPASPSSKNSFSWEIMSWTTWSLMAPDSIFSLMKSLPLVASISSLTSSSWKWR